MTEPMIITLGPQSLRTIDGDSFLITTSRKDPAVFAVTDPALVEWASRLQFMETYRATVTLLQDKHLLVSLTPCLAAAVSSDTAPSWSNDVSCVGPDDLQETLIQIRSFLEEAVWPELLTSLGENAYPPRTAPSAGLCRLSAPIVRDLLLRSFPGGSWSIEGGHPSIAYGNEMRNDLSRKWDGQDGGLWDANRQAWDGHFWVVGQNDGEKIIVDLTADQYGWDTVTATRGDDPRYRGNMLPSAVRKETSAKRFLALIDGYADRFFVSPEPVTDFARCSAQPSKCPVP